MALAYRVDHAAEFSEAAIPSALDHATKCTAMVIYQVAAQPPESRWASASHNRSRQPGGTMAT
jgi:hypothetical protein